MTGILLINLGSPDSTQIPDVKRYLQEFLMDKRVIDYNIIKRTLLIKGIILRTRPPRTAEAYRKIWSDETGSPLIHISRQVKEKVQDISRYPVALAMRYANPDIESGISALYKQGVRKIIAVPLYPQYAMSSYETVWVQTLDVRDKKFPDVEIVPVKPFYNHPEYVSVMAAFIKQHLPEKYDHLLFSFHGIPERHIRKYGHPGTIHDFDTCYNSTDKDHNAICYIHQCYAFMQAVTKAAGIPIDKYSHSFQSRLGREKWMEPYTDDKFRSFSEQGVKDLVVICPAFVSDCLETLEEINMEGRKEFLENGGHSFTYIPCLNDDDTWVQALYKIILEGETDGYAPRLLMPRA